MMLTYMLNNTILTTAIENVGASWLYIKLVYTALVLPQSSGINLAIFQDQAEPHL